MLKVLDVDGAVRRVSGGWIVTGQPWAYDAERYARVSAARDVEQQAMLEYISTTECRMRFLRRQLDDPAAEPCGRCDNCGGPAATGRRGPGFGGRGPRRAGDTRCRRRTESTVADGDVRVGNRAVRPDPGRREGRDRAEAVGRLDGIGWGWHSATCWNRRPPTVRFRCRCGMPWWRCWTAGCRPAVLRGRDSTSWCTSNRRAGPPSSGISPKGWPGTGRCRPPRRSNLSTTARRRARRTPPGGWRPFWNGTD